MSSMKTIFDEIDQKTEKATKSIVKAPFGYIGGKSRSVKYILPMLPYMKTYVEPFGGSASVLLARKPSPCEVFNDRFAGVVAFYRCMRDKSLTDALINWIEWTVNSKEDFIFCQETWKDCADPVERAGRWLYMASYSYAGCGRSWGRTLDASSHKLYKRIPLIREVHYRFTDVLVDNADWYDCITKYDSPDTVFYIDPPYPSTDKGCYRHDLTDEDHEHLLDTIFSCKGFCAVSGYHHPIYSRRKWDETYNWKVFTPSGTRSRSDNVAEEYLWLKT